MTSTKIHMKILSKILIQTRSFRKIHTEMHLELPYLFRHEHFEAWGTLIQQGLHVSLSMGWNYLSIPIIYLTQKIMDVITYSCPNLSSDLKGRLIEAEWLIYVSNLTTIGSDNGLTPGRGQAIIWTNAGILLTGPLGTKFSEISIEIQTYSFKKVHLEMLSAKWWPFCLGFNVLNTLHEKEGFKGNAHCIIRKSALKLLPMTFQEKVTSVTFCNSK